MTSLCSRLLAMTAACCLVAAAEPDSRKRVPRQAEITVRLIEAGAAASRAGQDASQLVPAELKSLLRFQQYRLMDSGYVRGREGERLSIALAVNMNGIFKFRVPDDEPGGLRVEVEIEGPPNSEGKRVSLLETETTLKNGETVVLGASRMKDADRALIVLLTARLIP